MLSYWIYWAKGIFYKTHLDHCVESSEQEFELHYGKEAISEVVVAVSSIREDLVFVSPSPRIATWSPAGGEERTEGWALTLCVLFSIATPRDWEDCGRKRLEARTAVWLSLRLNSKAIGGDVAQDPNVVSDAYIPSESARVWVPKSLLIAAPWPFTSWEAVGDGSGAGRTRSSSHLLTSVWSGLSCCRHWERVGAG